MIGIDKNIKGKVAALTNVEIPNNRPDKYNEYSESFLYINFNKKNKQEEKVNKNIVSDKICELIIIINGEKHANSPVYNWYFLFTKPAQLKIITHVKESIIDWNTNTKYKFWSVILCKSSNKKNAPGILSLSKLKDISPHGK